MISVTPSMQSFPAATIRGEERHEGPYGDIDRFLTITQAEYDALPKKDEKTAYLIK